MSPQLGLQTTSGPVPLHEGEPLVESDPGADIDEPPDTTLTQDDFKRHGISRPSSDQQQSLLTKALQGSGDVFDPTRVALAHQRPSMSSNVSVASTAELTCDTGNTSPARAPSPSPPHPGMTYMLGRPEAVTEKAPEQMPARPRRISFACAEPPKIKPAAVAPSSPAKPRQTERRSTIKFACQAPPPKVTQDHKSQPVSENAPRKTSIKFACASKPNQQPAGVLASTVAKDELLPRSTAPTDSLGAAPVSGKYAVSANDLNLEGFRFHEFASDEPQPDDWILQDSASPKRRLTMSDIFQKELAIRKLAKEALEEDEAEDDEEEPESNLDDANEEDEDIDEDEDDEDEDEEDDDTEDDGYNTDNEDDSDNDSDGDDGDLEVDVPVWFPKQNPSARTSPGFEVYRPAMSLESDSSLFSAANVRVIPTHRMKIPRGKPNLPDSTDFVCGTFDEDRVVEDMYMTVREARKRSKLHAIPQDIDPSFPASDPEDEEDDDDVSSNGNNDSDEHILGFGELEDLHHGQQRVERRRRKSDACSPRARNRSPAPKRQASSPHKPRGRSPRPLFGHTPPRRHVSPAPGHFPRSPRASPVHKAAATGCKTLAGRPGLTATKSLPRPRGMFPGHLKRRKSVNSGKEDHTRGAIDIFKGLEEKRQRRREKYLQKYCNRARKGQIPEKKPVPPGLGVERMRELVTGNKRGPGYVLSF